MATSPLVPGSSSGQNDRSLGRGHGTGALGPSDSSDSGSDVQGIDAERQLGDAGLDSDSDRSGTGERLGATPDTEFEPGADIAPDQIESMPVDDETGDEEADGEKAGEDEAPTSSRPGSRSG